MILMIIYMVLGYWATGKTIYANKIIFETRFGAFFLQRVIMGTILGWILIPWALIKMLLKR